MDNKENKEKNKKLRISEIVFIIILLIILILFLIMAWRYYILINIQENNSLYLNKTNYYYYSENNNMTIECWRKSGITKLNLKQKNRNGDITFWKNSKTGEGYVFYNTTKKYSKDQNGMLNARPSSMTTSTDNFTKFLLAINPTIYIRTKEYEGKKCYSIKIDNQEELIEKDTGLLLNVKTEEDERILKYSFDNVTDEDVKMPDVSEYILQEKNVLQ